MPGLIALLFLFSGLAALLYEILWVRSIGYVLGASSSSIALVVGGYLTGLAAGAFAAGRLDLGRRTPLRTYATLELCIGASAPWVPDLVALLDRAVLDPSWESLRDFHATVPVQFLLVLIVTFLPTALMGATLPVLCNALREVWARPGAVIGWLYGLNTLGGVAGCLVAGFLMIETLGIRTSLWTAAGANVVLALAAFVLDQRSQGRLAPPRTEEAPAPRTLQSAAPSDWVIGALVLVFSFLSIGFEILWTRLIALTVGGTTYAFSLVLAVFLLGLGAGALLVGFLMRRFVLGAGFLGVTQALLGLIVLSSVGSFDELSHWIGLKLFETRGSLSARAGYSLLACLIVGGAPALLLGVPFPLLSDLWIGVRGRIARGVGSVYVLSTVGGVLGSTLTTFVLMPRLSLEMCLIGLSLLSTVVGCLCLVLERGLFRWTAAAVALTLAMGLSYGGLDFLPRAAWDPRSVYLSAALYGTTTEQENRRVLKVRDGDSSSVAVFELGRGRELAVNGKVDASTRGDMATQLWLAYLPQLLHPDPESVFVLGYGSGVTAGAAARYGSNVVCAEIESGVLEASQFFESVNFGAHRNARVELCAEDGRALLRRGARTYDVITTEPSNPWMAGMASLFTKEFYELCSSRLKAGGILCQWVHLYWMSPEDYLAILSTVRSVFPHVGVFRTQPVDASVARFSGDTLLLAAPAALALDYGAIEQRLEGRPQVLDDLQKASPLLREGRGWFSRYLSMLLLLYGPDVDRCVESVDRVITDDLPFLEFSAARRMHASLADQIARRLLLHRTIAEYGDETWFNAEQRGFGSLYRGTELLTHDLVEPALQHLERALIEDPSLTASAELPLWVARLRRGDSEAKTSGLADLEKRDPRSLLRAADELSKAGEVEIAFTTLQRYCDRFGTDAASELLRGRILLRLGRDSEARRAFEKVLGIDPGNAAARKRLEELDADE